MKKILFIASLLFCYSITTLIASSAEGYLPFFMNGSNSKIHVIEEDNEEVESDNQDCSDSNSTQVSSGKDSAYSIQSNDEKRQQFLDTLKSNNHADLMSSLRDIENDIFTIEEDQDNENVPFYIADNKKDAIAFTTNLSLDAHDTLMAAGANLSNYEYKLLKSIERQAFHDEFSVEYHVRDQFIHAIRNGYIEKVKALIDIDNCLRYQDYLYSKNNLRYGPLLSSIFENNLTALHYAIASNKAEIVEFFIEKQVNLYAKANPKAIESQYNPVTPLDFAMVYRESHNTDMQELMHNSKIIDMLIKAGVKKKSNDANIQSMIDEYMTMKFYRPIHQQKSTMYQSFKDLFNSRSSKVAPL